MKYLVNKETKEHKIYNPFAADDDWRTYNRDWRIVEADKEGWIPFDGRDRPLPEHVLCEIVTDNDSARAVKETLRADRWAWNLTSGEPARIIAYRPILAEKEEPESRTGVAMEEFVSAINGCASRLETESVFDRLRQATEAAESIPAILAEINALLPEGYCVEKKTTAPEDMENHENWKEGDILECISNDVAYCTKGNLYAIGYDHDREYGIFDNDGDVLSPRHPGGDHYSSRFFRFHSRPVKS